MYTALTKIHLSVLASVVYSTVKIKATAQMARKSQYYMSCKNSTVVVTPIVVQPKKIDIPCIMFHALLPIRSRGTSIHITLQLYSCMPSMFHKFAVK